MGRWKFGVVANAQHQKRPAVLTKIAENCSLAVIEYDDQGRCYDLGDPAAPSQLDLILGELERYAARDAVIVVFVHGWKHNGASEDTNLCDFKTALADLAQREKDSGAPILGIFVAWRGRSLYGPWLIETTFWGRKQAALRVSMGAPRELFAHLRQWRRKRLHAGGEPLLVVIGHSFGGMIVHAAVGQSLIEAAATQSGRVTPAFADLVLLINPAFEAVRYLPIHDITNRQSATRFDPDQPPAFISVTALNDRATGVFFPLGMFYSLLQEATRGALEREALTHTMGHLEWMFTHRLSTIAPTPADPAKPYGATWLRPIAQRPRTPFWSMSATPAVIDGHNGIWKDEFQSFVRAIMHMHIDAASARRAAKGVAGAGSLLSGAVPVPGGSQFQTTTEG